MYFFHTLEILPRYAPYRRNKFENLPDEFSNKVLEYIEYLKYSAITSKAPQNIIIKDKKDLRAKLEEGIKDTENGNTCSLDEAFIEIDKLLAE